MSSVPAHLRGQANAVSVFLMHLLGDFPSPYLVGVVSHFVGAKWGMVILASWLFIGSLAWVAAWSKAVHFMQKHARLAGEEEEQQCLVIKV